MCSLGSPLQNVQLLQPQTPISSGACLLQCTGHQFPQHFPHPLQCIYSKVLLAPKECTTSPAPDSMCSASPVPAVHSGQQLPPGFPYQGGFVAETPSLNSLLGVPRRQISSKFKKTNFQQHGVPKMTSPQYCAFSNRVWISALGGGELLLPWKLYLSLGVNVCSLFLFYAYVLQSSLYFLLDNPSSL